MQLTETTLHPPGKVDREAGVIHDVKILGSQSLYTNGKVRRRYSESAMQQAAKLYEGRKVNLDHPERDNPDKERGVLDGFGELRGVSVKPDGVYGDLHYLKAHPAAAVVTEAAERMPKQFGLSHNADGDERKINGESIVESVTLVRSVDLVGKPATNKGIFESEEPMTKTIREIAKAAPGTFGGKVLLEMDGELGPLGDAPIEVAADVDADGQIDAAFKSAMHKMLDAVLDDKALDVKGKAKKMQATMKSILSAMEKVSGVASETPKESATPPAEETKTESQTAEAATVKAILEAMKPELDELKKQVTSLTGERDTLKAKDVVRGLLESAKREVTDLRVTALLALADEKVRKELIESWPEKGVKRPASSPSILESSAPATVTDGKSFAAAILK